MINKFMVGKVVEFETEDEYDQTIEGFGRILGVHKPDEANDPAVLTVEVRLAHVTTTERNETGAYEMVCKGRIPAGHILYIPTYRIYPEWSRFAKWLDHQAWGCGHGGGPCGCKQPNERLAPIFQRICMMLHYHPWGFDPW